MRKTATGPRSAKPRGNHAGGHSMSASGSSRAPSLGLMPTSPPSAEKDRTTLFHWNAKDKRPDDTSTAEPVHSDQLLMALYVTSGMTPWATMAGARKP